VTAEAAGGIVLLDGGLATQLERAGHDLSDGLWSARLLQDDPGAVRDAHLAYFRAGAQVATTASYQASVQGFRSRGLSSARAEEMIRSSVTLARSAADHVAEESGDGGRRLVAASVGPYGAVRADGSEFHGDYGRTDAELRRFHLPRLELLAGSGADLLAVETIPSEQEATVLLDLLTGLAPGVPAWLSLTCADAGRTRCGEDVRRVFGLARGVDAVAAVGVNCTAPEHVADLVTAAVESSGKPGVAYPNSGETWDALARRWRGEARGVDPDAARDWVRRGARYVGGCCRVDAEDIARLAAALGRSG
jgi:homocysteine S-methyltransferase